uniref:Uncharacterized protein n=1 Tax=viral metagenome TaxID=1070528 RepID=A0A6M3JSU6_9ZZZZ
MCTDLEAAARNRKMVADKRNIVGYQFIEAFVKAWPRNKPLPEWITMGNLPKVDKSERKNLTSYGIYEIGDNGLLNKERINYGNEP